MDALRLIAYVISKACWFIRYEGRENIPPKSFGGFLIAANHQSYVDPVWIILPMRRKLRFMAVEKAFKWTFIGPLIEYLGSFPVSDDLSGSLSAMKESIRSLRAGAVLTVFPEGEREAADGETLPFKTGAVRIAYQANVPILPVTVRGANRIWPFGQKYPNFFRRVTITYHPLVVMKKELSANRGDLDLKTEELRRTIDSVPK
ncbi:MAG: lysophospholipid acyltransferase family protein [Acidobacteriota bacterium]